jgi:hypothetical protein
MFMDLWASSTNLPPPPGVEGYPPGDYFAQSMRPEVLAPCAVPVDGACPAGQVLFRIPREIPFATGLRCSVPPFNPLVADFVIFPEGDGWGSAPFLAVHVHGSAQWIYTEPPAQACEAGEIASLDTTGQWGCIPASDCAMPATSYLRHSQATWFTFCD